MGIKDLYKVLKAECPEQIVTYDLSEFTGLRFAIDISIFLYKTIRSAGENRWMNSFITLLCTLKKNSIKAVCVFDGPNPPKEKGDEQLRRRADNAKAISRMKCCINLRNRLQEQMEMKNEDVPVDEITTLLGKKSKGVDVYDLGSVCNALNDLVERLRNQTLPVTDKHKNLAKRIVKMMGLGCIQADGEAETICAYLAVKGYVDAVLSEDTDVLAYSTPMFIAFKEFGIFSSKVYGLHLPSILKSMKFTKEQFRDMCILLSCDYNKRATGFPLSKNFKKPTGIGAKYAPELVREYGCIENMLERLAEYECLRYERCRELFKIPEKFKGLNKMIPINSKIDVDEIGKLIDDYSLSVRIEYIQSCWKSPEIIFQE